MTALSVRAAARESPDGLALIAADGTRWTWRQLAAEVQQLSTGAGDDSHPDRRVRILDATPSPETVFRILAAIEDRVPFAPLDPRSPPGETRARRGLLARESEAMAILFTSGSTGNPRAVELSRSAFVASARASAGRLGWRDGDRWLCVLPLAHVGGLSILTRCLAARRAIVLADRFDAEATADLVEREQVTLASLVPTMLARLFDLGDRRAVNSRLASLRAVLVGGAAAPDALWEESAGRGMPVLETWGMTETCSQVATARPNGDPRALVPLDGWEVRCVEGHLEVRGEALFSRYLEQDGARRPVDEDGWFRTGDTGRIDPDGSVTVLGRADGRIVSGGENVEPAEVERFLESLPGIRRAVVLGIPDPEWGETVAAALERVPGHGGDPSGADPELEGVIRAGLAPWKRPRRVVWLDRFPETASGKVDRARVRARVLAGLTSRHTTS
ncbi:MAG: fatty acid--CoA ligase family protein [Gemmatimonadota bacterium]